MEETQMHPDEEYIRFHVAIGEAVTNWANVEGAMAELFEVCMNGNANSPGTPSVAFFAIESFSSKLKVLSSVVARRFPTYADQWRTLSERLKRASVSRNKVAHSSTIQLACEPFGKQWRLRPSLSNPAKSLSEPGMHCIEIEKTVSNFTSLAMAVTSFRLDAMGLPNPFKGLAVE